MAHPSTRRRFLFVLWEGGGNVAPQLAVARRLAARGHTVRVLGEACLRADVEACGCAFAPFAHAPSRPDRTPATDYMRDWEARTPIGAFARVRDRVLFGPASHHARDVVEALEREPADAAVIDWMLFGAATGAERAAVPFATLVHTIWQVPTPGMPAPGPGFQPMRGPLGRVRDAVGGRLFIRLFEAGLPRLNQARSELGLPAFRDLRQVLARPDRALVLTSPAFDWPAAALPANLRYVGPQLEDPAWASGWESPWPADHPDPLVVVSLSTTPQGQGAMLQRIVDALRGMPVRGLVTTGPAVDPAGLHAPPNVVVRHAAPHSLVFRDASVVVTHGGHGTVMRALAAGVPLLCLPMGRDQPDIAARVVHRGLGLRRSAGSSSAALRGAIARLLAEPSYREAARRMSATLAEECRRDDAVAELEALAGGATGAGTSRPSARQ